MPIRLFPPSPGTAPTVSRESLTLLFRFNCIGFDAACIRFDAAAAAQIEYLPLRQIPQKFEILILESYYLLV